MNYLSDNTISIVPLEMETQNFHKIVVVKTQKDLKHTLNGNIITTNTYQKLAVPLGPCVALVGRKVMSDGTIIGFLTHFYKGKAKEGIENLREDLKQFGLNIEDFNIVAFGGNRGPYPENSGLENREALKKEISGVEFAHEQRYGGGIQFDIKTGVIIETINYPPVNGVSIKKFTEKKYIFNKENLVLAA